MKAILKEKKHIKVFQNLYSHEHKINKHGFFLLNFDYMNI